MKTLMLVFLVNLVFLECINCKKENVGLQKTGGLFYRISIEEFNKVGNALLQSPTDSTLYYGYGVGQTNGTSGRFQYQFSNVKTSSPSSGPLRPTMTRANITKDSRMLVETMLPETELSGNIVVKRLVSKEVIYTGPFQISFGKMKMHSKGGKEDGPSVQLRDALHIVTLNFPDCEVDMKDIKMDDKVNVSVTNNGDNVMTAYEQRQMYQHLICDEYRLRIPLAFGESNTEFNIADHNVTIRTEATDLEIRQDGIYIAQTVSSTNIDGLFTLPLVPTNQPMKIPPFSGEHYPFEVAVSVETFEQIVQAMKREFGIGVRPLSLLDVVPFRNRDRYELDTNGIIVGMLFPEMGAVFPKSVAEMNITDVDFAVEVEEGKIHLIVDITCNMFVTLNCDTNRTYSAMNFTLNFGLPVQVGHDNEYLTMNILGFGANMTVLNSNIGHVANDQFRTMMNYVATQVKQKTWDNINKKTQGLRIRDFLPSGVYENIQAIKIVKDNIVICGNLTTTDPMLKKLNRSEIAWVGQPMQDSDKYMNVADKTPVNLQAMKEKNCKPEPEVKANKVTSGTKMIHHDNAFCLLIVSYIVLVFIR